jgi:hypothetical protein
MLLIRQSTLTPGPTPSLTLPLGKGERTESLPLYEGGRLGWGLNYPLGNPSPRLAIMLRWTSEVPAAILWEKLIIQCS